MTATDPVPAWVHLDDAGYTDEEPWLWTCGDCGLSMARGEIPAHRDDHARRSAGVIVWMLGALALLVVVALVVVIVRWPR